MSRVLKYFKDREWAATVGVLGTIVAALPVFLEVVSGELEQAGDKWDWKMVFPILIALAIRWNVWSRRSVTTVAETTAQVAAETVNEQTRKLELIVRDSVVEILEEHHLNTT